MKIYIVIPAYNEEKNIEKVITQCKSEGYENIIVVDDGSTDKTIEKAQKHNIEILEHCTNRGVGAATQTGLTYGQIQKADIVVTLDGDTQHTPRDIHSLIEAVEQGYDMVIGSRFLKKKNRIPWIRKLFNKIANIITFILSGYISTDSQSGLKAFSKKALKKIYITSNGYEFCSEVIRQARFEKLTIKEVPISVSYTEDSLSKGQNFDVGIKTVFRLMIQSLMK